MNTYNPGNVLPFYDNRAWQRHRQIGQDTIPFGITGTRARLLPFQLYVTGDATTDIITFNLINAVSDSGAVTLDETLLTRTEKADNSGYWITWNAAVDTVPDCGFWYVQLTVDGMYYYSEVMYLTDFCGLNDVGLELLSCNVVTLEMMDYISVSIQRTYNPTAPTSIQHQKYISGVWTNIGTSAGFINFTTLTSAETDQYRIIAVMECGVTITATYTLTWDSADVCATLTFVQTGYAKSFDSGDLERNVWRLAMTNTTDKANVLYQEGYTQHLYISPIWDTPEVRREVQTDVNGNGDTVRTFSRTIEQQKFEFPDMPDYVLGFLSKVGDLSSVILEEAETGRTVTMENVTFESKRQGALLNIGIITFDAEIESYSGCQEDFELV